MSIVQLSLRAEFSPVTPEWFPHRIKEKQIPEVRAAQSPEKLCARCAIAISWQCLQTNIDNNTGNYNYIFIIIITNKILISVKLNLQNLQLHYAFYVVKY